MAKQTGRDTVRAVVGPAVVEAGLYLEDVTVGRAGKNPVLRIVVDLPENETGSVDLDAIADVSRAVSDALDASDIMIEPYTLEVSTPGIGRRMTQLRHFKRACSRLVTVTLHSGETFTGRLLDADDVLRIDVSPQVREVRFEDLAYGHVEVEFSRSSTIDGSDEEE